MKSLIPFLLIGALQAETPGRSHVNFIRQQQQASGVVWDMPVVTDGDAPPALMSGHGGTLFQLWGIEANAAEDHLLDQKLIGSYVPAVEVKVTSFDPYKPVARTRVDQPFVLDINITGLLTGTGLPVSATSVVLERHIASFANGQTAMDPAVVRANAPIASAYISNNGRTSLRFAASALTAPDATKAAGEEHFVIHAISDGTQTQTQLAAGFVQVWPVASGAIKGISNGETLRDRTPELELELDDLYPKSDTYLMLFEGSQVTGVEGETIAAFPMDRDTCESHVLAVTDLDAHLGEEGTYTLALLSDTIYGRELLCEPVTFSVSRPLLASARIGRVPND